MKRLSGITRAGIVVFGIFGSTAALEAQAPTPLPATTGCYVQSSGTIYVTGLPDAPTDCKGSESANRPHRPITWQGGTGSQGAKGDVGAQGLKGDAGIQGVTGDKGDTGAQGLKGDAGVQGIQGLKGDQGIQGEKGDQGIQGLKGDQGIQGEKGDQGIQGLKGDQGIQGLKGDQGIQGLKGDQGIQGEKGDQGIQGITGLVGYLRISITSTLDIANVSCPAGKVVLSGGYVAPSNGAVLVQQSYPSSDNTWTVVVKNTGNARVNFQAWAICGLINR